MNTSNVYLHSPPTGDDWTHIDDFWREVQDRELRTRFLKCSGLPTSSKSLHDSLHYVSGVGDYLTYGLVKTAIVLGGMGFYIQIPGYSQALYDGPQAMRELLDRIHQKWSAIEMLKNIEAEPTKEDWEPDRIWNYKTGVRIK